MSERAFQRQAYTDVVGRAGNGDSTAARDPDCDSERQRPAALPLAFALVGRLSALNDLLARLEEAVAGPIPADAKPDPNKPVCLMDSLIRATADADRAGKRVMDLLETFGRDH